MLGNWQTKRAVERENAAQELQSQTQKAPLVLQGKADQIMLVPFRRVKVTGQFVKEWPVYLDNRPLYGSAGFYAVMPFKIQGSDWTILVERGWLQRNPMDRSKLPDLLTPEGFIQIEGILRTQIDRSMQLGETELARPGAIVQNLSVDMMRKQTGLKMFDLVMQQTTDTTDGLLRDWPQPSAGSDKNRAYAFQWYGLALMAAIFFVVTGIRRGKNK
jgi:cytochrome oxidase assembly protein ShyY1